MSFTIQTNVSSLVAQENLRVNNEFQARTIQRLTSGYRINSSGDDAAGLAVANKFRSDVAELLQGVRNANDGLSQLQIIDGGLNNISKSLDRLKTYDATLLCPGHGPPVRDVARKLQELIDHRRERESQILTAVGQGRGRLEAMLADIYPELDRRLLGMARAQLLAHLHKLQSEGRIARRDEAAGTLYVLP